MHIGWIFVIGTEGLDFSDWTLHIRFDGIEVDCVLHTRTHAHVFIYCGFRYISI